MAEQTEVRIKILPINGGIILAFRDQISHEQARVFGQALEQRLGISGLIIPEADIVEHGDTKVIEFSGPIDKDFADEIRRVIDSWQSKSNIDTQS